VEAGYSRIIEPGTPATNRWMKHAAGVSEQEAVPREEGHEDTKVTKKRKMKG